MTPARGPSTAPPMTPERVQALLLSGPMPGPSGQEPTGAGEYRVRRTPWPRCHNCHRRDEATIAVTGPRSWWSDLRYPEAFHARVRTLRTDPHRPQLIDLCPPCVQLLDRPEDEPSGRQLTFGE